MQEKLPKATHQGELVFGDAKIPCFVLEDGRRVISGRAMTKAIGMRGRGQGVLRISAHKTLKPFINDELESAINNPINFLGVGSRPTAGYEATILHDLCQAVLEARDANSLKTDQELRYAKYCDALIRSFAKVGIIALVDEATGYQYERDRSALHKILEAYVAKELLPWAERFPDEFYSELFRLREWRYSPLSIARPAFVGKLTNEIIYDRLPPGVKSELQNKNPKDPETKRRKHKHHQFLTYELGVPHLERHLASVITLMRASPNWVTFKRLFTRAFPKHGDQLDLELDE